MMRSVISEDIEDVPSFLNCDITPEEFLVIEYITGYILKKIINKFKNDGIKRSCLQHLVETCGTDNNLIDCLNRGRLTIPTRQTINYIIFMEKAFRNMCTKGKFNRDIFKKTIDEKSKQMFLNLKKECVLESERKTELHEKFFNLFFNVRIHSHLKNLAKKCSDIKKTKSLRKGLKSYSNVV